MIMEVICEGVIEGIEYKIVRFRKNGFVTIFIRCPRCGRFGRLNRYKNGFIIRHKVNGAKILIKGCQFGWTSSEYETLKKIYEMKSKLMELVIK